MLAMYAAVHRPLPKRYARYRSSAGAARASSPSTWRTQPKRSLACSRASLVAEAV